MSAGMEGPHVAAPAASPAADVDAGGPQVAVPVFSRLCVVPYRQLPADAAPINGEPSDLYVVATSTGMPAGCWWGTNGGRRATTSQRCCFCGWAGSLQVFSTTFNALVVSFQSLHPKLVQVAHSMRGDWCVASVVS